MNKTSDTWKFKRAIVLGGGFIVYSDVIKKGEKIYYARALQKVDIYELCELNIRTVKENWFAAYEDKSKQVFLFSNKDIGNIVFTIRKDALVRLNETKKKGRY